jgi:hypothetical protein
MEVFNLLVWSWIGIAIITFLVLVIFKIKAPYGRHTSNRWGKMIANHWGWFWMELPALLVFPMLTIFGPAEKSLLSWLLIGLWVIHYFYRTLIFPFKVKAINKKMPLVIVLSALFFNMVTGFFIGYYIGFISQPNTSLLSANVFIGFIMFFAGMYINRTSDNILLALKKENKGYQIPKGWLFNYISCPNLLGEIIEWTGFAVIAWNLPAASFAIWTFCNLVPRALNHHKWYHEKFSNYPENRKALFPFFL